MRHTAALLIGLGLTGCGSDQAGPPTEEEVPASAQSACTVTTPDDASCTGCTVLEHYDVQCDDPNFTERGVHVLHTSQATTVTTASLNLGIVMDVADGELAFDAGVPPELRYATALAERDPQDDLALLFDSTQPAPSAEDRYPGGLTLARRTDAGWALEEVSDQDKFFTPVAFAWDTDADEVSAWYDSGGLALAVRAADGTWSVDERTPAGIAYAVGLDGARWVFQQSPVDVDGETLQQLSAHRQGEGFDIAAPMAEAGPFVVAPSRRHVSAGSTPFVLVYAADELRVLGRDIDIPIDDADVFSSTDACQGDDADTPAACAELPECRETGAGVRPAEFAIAWHDNTHVLVAYVHTQFDQTYGFGWSADESFEGCLPSVRTDSSEAELRVARVALDDGAVEQLVAVPTEPDVAGQLLYRAQHAIDLDTDGDAFSVAWRYSVGFDHYVRVIRATRP